MKMGSKYAFFVLSAILSHFKILAGVKKHNFLIKLYFTWIIFAHISQIKHLYTIYKHIFVLDKVLRQNLGKNTKCPNFGISRSSENCEFNY